MSTSVVNLNHRPKPAYDVYVGREGKGQSGYFGNPHSSAHVGPCRHCFAKFRIKVKHEGDEALEKFELAALTRITEDLEFASGVLKLRDRVLACFCVKRDGTGKCHALFYARWLDGLKPGALVEDLVAFARMEFARLAAEEVEAADGR